MNKNETCMMYSKTLYMYAHMNRINIHAIFLFEEKIF